jgi:exodeoxyribonuclease-3
MDKLVAHNWTDTYRLINKDKIEYSWWSQRSGARPRNIGWRIDYFFIDKKLESKIIKAFILKDVMGSDHCPVGIEIRL